MSIEVFFWFYLCLYVATCAYYKGNTATDRYEYLRANKSDVHRDLQALVG